MKYSKRKSKKLHWNNPDPSISRYRSYVLISKWRKRKKWKKDSSDSKWGEKFSREKGVSSEIAGRICRRAGRKRVGGGGEKRIISDGRRNERMDERERVRERRGEGRVICTGRRYAGWIFHEENSVTGRRFSGHVELVRRRAAFRSISDLVRTFAFLFNVRCLWIRREFPSCFPPLRAYNEFLYVTNDGSSSFLTDGSKSRGHFWFEQFLIRLFLIVNRNYLI